jgi:hypothetical protein
MLQCSKDISLSRICCNAYSSKESLWWAIPINEQNMTFLNRPIVALLMKSCLLELYPDSFLQKQANKKKSDP